MQHATDTAHKTVTANAGKVVNSDSTGKRRVVFDQYVPAEHGAVGNDDVIAHRAVVSDMAATHEVTVVTNRRDSAIFFCAAIDCDTFANDIIVTDANFRGFSAVTDILRLAADDRTRVNVIKFTKRCVAFDRYVVFNDRTTSNNRVRADVREGSDPHVVTQLGAWVDVCLC